MSQVVPEPNSTREGDRRELECWKMASNAAVPFWRAAGMTYITYSNICANLVRNCLKEPYKTEVLTREKVHFSVSKWVDSKPQKPSMIRILLSRSGIFYMCFDSSVILFSWSSASLCWLISGILIVFVYSCVIDFWIDRIFPRLKIYTHLVTRKERTNFLNYREDIFLD